jgi:hypothetical protein
MFGIANQSQKMTENWVAYDHHGRDLLPLQWRPQLELQLELLVRGAGHEIRKRFEGLHRVRVARS